MAYFNGEFRFSRSLTEEEVDDFLECAAITDPCHWVITSDRKRLEWNGVTPFPGYMLALSVLYDGFFFPNRIKLEGQIEVENALGRVVQIITGNSIYRSEPEIDLTASQDMDIHINVRQYQKIVNDTYDTDDVLKMEFPKPPHLETSDTPINRDAPINRDDDISELVEKCMKINPIPAAAQRPSNLSDGLRP